MSRGCLVEKGEREGEEGLGIIFHQFIKKAREEGRREGKKRVVTYVDCRYKSLDSSP
jgi:hypothetical protein